MAPQALSPGGLPQPSPGLSSSKSPFKLLCPNKPRGLRSSHEVYFLQLTPQPAQPCLSATSRSSLLRYETTIIRPQSSAPVK